MDLMKAYDRFNRKALWQVLGMYNVGDKLLNGIESMYVNSLACVKAQGDESECFRIDSGVSCPLRFTMYIGFSDGGENEDGEKRSEISG